MKPPAFDYVAAHSVDDAVGALAAPGAVVLAGGQSLVLELVYREIRPTVLVDINDVPGLGELTGAAGGVRIGATVRHADLERGDERDPVLRLLSRAAPYVAHPPIRARGTFCGSVAWAHPASEWNAIAAGLGASMQVRSAAGERSVTATDCFTADRQTARRPDELLLQVTFPPLDASAGVGFAEHRRTHASFADVAVGVALTATAGRVEAAHVGVANVGPTPVRATEVQDALAGTPVAEAARTAGAALAPRGDRRRDAVAAELLRRAVAEAVADLR